MTRHRRTKSDHGSGLFKERQFLRRLPPVLSDKVQHFGHRRISRRVTQRDWTVFAWRLTAGFPHAVRSLSSSSHLIGLLHASFLPRQPAVHFAPRYPELPTLMLRYPLFSTFDKSSLWCILNSAFSRCSDRYVFSSCLTLPYTAGSVGPFVWQSRGRGNETFCRVSLSNSKIWSATRLELPLILSYSYLHYSVSRCSGRR